MFVVVRQTAGGHEVDVEVFGPRATHEEAVGLATSLASANAEQGDSVVPADLKRDLTEVGWHSDPASGDFWCVSPLEVVGAA